MPEVTYTDYPFRLQPYSHQYQCWKISKDLEYYGLFLDQGTGKSKIIIDTAGYLFLSGKIDALLIMTPKGVLNTWVENEVPTHMSEAVNFKLGFWGSSLRKEEKTKLRELYEPGNFLRVLVVNVEAVVSERAVDFVADFLKQYKTLMVVDESTVLKNPQAKRTKICINLGKHAAYRRICTGNPLPNGSCDLYSQTEFLKKNLLGFVNFYAFRNRFCVMQEKRFGSHAFKVIVGYRENEKLKQLIRQFAFVIKKEDCLELPPKVYQTVDVELGPKQKIAYNKMVEDAYVQINDGEMMSAPLVITQMLRLHQIACGYLAPDGAPPIPFDEPNDRLNTLMDLLEQANGKCVIWANYRYNVRQILEEITKKYGKQSVVHFYGDTTQDERSAATRSFNNDPEVRFILANGATGKFGNTWLGAQQEESTAATTVLYYSNDYNLETRAQSEDRAHRIGQKYSVTYIDLQVRGTVDVKIVNALKGKKKLTDEIVASNWKWLIGEKIL